jgi:hypothetical protein|nr:MAG: hypothetical protein [Bacteriophage sp.]DAI01246.1 MAG TPA: hypothetical protein [Caudoviricetes sp.]
MLTDKPTTLDKFEECSKNIENYCRIGPIGNGIYCIGKGIYTGIKGWENFQKILKEQKEQLKKLNNHK